MHARLVTDDERSVRSAVRRALTLEGYRVTEAEDGAREQADEILEDLPERLDEKPRVPRAPTPGPEEDPGGRA